MMPFLAQSQKTVYLTDCGECVWFPFKLHPQEPVCDELVWYRYLLSSCHGAICAVSRGHALQPHVHPNVAAHMYAASGFNSIIGRASGV